MTNIFKAFTPLCRVEDRPILINIKKVTSKDLAKSLEIDEDKIIQLIEALKKDGIVKTSKNKYIEINSN